MSPVKQLCKSTELKRCIPTDRHWKRNPASRSYPEKLPNLRPSSPRNPRDEELKAPKFSIAIAWNISLLLLILLLFDKVMNTKVLKVPNCIKTKANDVSNCADYVRKSMETARQLTV